MPWGLGFSTKWNWRSFVQMELELGMSLFHHVPGDFITQIGKKHDSSQQKRVLNIFEPEND
jgi:hypothetical protein